MHFKGDEVELTLAMVVSIRAETSTPAVGVRLRLGSAPTAPHMPLDTIISYWDHFNFHSFVESNRIRRNWEELKWRRYKEELARMYL